MNKKLILLLAGLGIAFGAPITASATPEDDLKEFQGYFKKKFPTVPLEAYSDGVNSLPQYADRVGNWELIMEFPPYNNGYRVCKNIRKFKHTFALGSKFFYRSSLLPTHLDDGQRSYAGYLRNLLQLYAGIGRLLFWLLQHRPSRLWRSV